MDVVQTPERQQWIRVYAHDWLNNCLKGQPADRPTYQCHAHSFVRSLSLSAPSSPHNRPSSHLQESVSGQLVEQFAAEGPNVEPVLHLLHLSDDGGEVPGRGEGQAGEGRREEWRGGERGTGFFLRAMPCRAQLYRASNLRGHKTAGTASVSSAISFS